MRKLTNIQWRITRYTIWVSLIVSSLLITIIFFYLGLDFQLLFILSNWFYFPLVVLLLSLVLIIGLIAGYIYGNLMKKRLERLVESILKFEHGNYSHRVPSLGEDEIGLVASHLNQMAERIQKQVASLQKLSTEKAEYQEQMKQSVITEERQRLSRELHDAVSQQLFAISMMSSAVQENTSDEKVLKQINMVENMAGNAQNEMRALLLHLRPATLEGKGLTEGLEDLLEDFKAKQPLDIRWEVSDMSELPKGVEDHLFRVVQEGLSNIFRHSDASAITIKLGMVNRQVLLKIIDNGVGFDMNKTKTSSYGLQSIQERANEIGGVADIISFPGKGTQIEMKVPIVDEERK